MSDNNRDRSTVNCLHIAIDDAWHRLSSKSTINKTLTYGYKRWVALMRFLEDGAEVDSNIVERTICSVAIGRKNWLYAASKVSGKCTVAIYSIIEICKLNGVKQRGYVTDVMGKIASRWPASRWDKLMPWN